MYRLIIYLLILDTKPGIIMQTRFFNRSSQNNLFPQSVSERLPSIRISNEDIGNLNYLSQKRSKIFQLEGNILRVLMFNAKKERQYSKRRAPIMDNGAGQQFDARVAPVQKRTVKVSSHPSSLTNLTFKSTKNNKDEHIPLKSKSPSTDDETAVFNSVGEIRNLSLILTGVSCIFTSFLIIFCAVWYRKSNPAVRLPNDDRDSSTYPLLQQPIVIDEEEPVMITYKEVLDTKSDNRLRKDVARKTPILTAKAITPKGIHSVKQETPDSKDIESTVYPSGTPSEMLSLLQPGRGSSKSGESGTSTRRVTKKRVSFLIPEATEGEADDYIRTNGEQPSSEADLERSRTDQHPFLAKEGTNAKSVRSFHRKSKHTRPVSGLPNGNGYNRTRPSKTQRPLDKATSVPSGNEGTTKKRRSSEHSEASSTVTRKRHLSQNASSFEKKRKKANCLQNLIHKIKATRSKFNITKPKRPNSAAYSEGETADLGYPPKTKEKKITRKPRR